MSACSSWGALQLSKRWYLKHPPRRSFFPKITFQHGLRGIAPMDIAQSGSLRVKVSYREETHIHVFVSVSSTTYPNMGLWRHFLMDLEPREGKNLTLRRNVLEKWYTPQIVCLDELINILKDGLATLKGFWLKSLRMAKKLRKQFFSTGPSSLNPA